MRNINVAIVDDSPFFRKIIRDLLEKLGGFNISEFHSADEFLFKIKSNYIEDLHLVLLDINMPGTSGKDAIPEISSSYPESIIIMMSTMKDMDTVEDCLSLGAVNYINKDEKIEKIEYILLDTIDMYL